jgi:alcohol dehydrogenase class IV
MRSSWSFQTAGQLVFGPGAMHRLGELTARLGAKRVLIVTDAALISLGFEKTIRDSLSSAKIAAETFGAGQPEPAIDVALAAIEQAKSFSPDAILGLGGGSNLDLAKIVAACHAHGGKPRDYFGFDKIPGPVTTTIGVPTTAGTGSEVSHAAVLTDAENHIKVSTLSQYLRPALAVVDPELTHSCPAKVTADSGIDALTHAIEACTATDFSQMEAAPGEALAYEGRHPLGDVFADRAIELIGRHLVACVRDPANGAAREGMALAATLAGIAFSNCGVALVHGLEYPIGGAVHCSHGAGNGLLLPYVMRFNLPERKAEFARIARLLGGNLIGLSIESAAERAIDLVIELRAAIGIPARLRDLGVAQSQLPEFAAKTFGIKRLLATNARRASEEDLLGILREAY